MSASRGHLKTAIIAVKANRWRSFLTMFGVIVGVASVVTVVGIGEGVKAQLGNQIDRLGKDVITIRPATLNGEQTNQPLPSPSGFVATGTLSASDVQQVAHSKNVQLSVPLSLAAGAVKGDNTYKDGPVIATSKDLPRVVNQSMAYGVFFTAEESDSNVAVLGQHAAEQLFNQDVPLGRSFIFRGQEFVVRGVFNEFTAVPFSNDVNFNNAIFIPTAVANQLTHNGAPLYEILAKASSQATLGSAASAIRQQLLKNHGGQQDFSVQKPSESLAASSAIFDVFTELIAGVAAVSLLVGGIGIMNVMLVSVTERMHEIGVRKAVGATNRQILNQFMIEATTLSVVGGLIGVVVSLIVDVVLRITTDLTPVISWQVLLLAAGISIVVGIVFGSAPALKAARKDPIEALRSE